MTGRWMGLMVALLMVVGCSAGTQGAEPLPIAEVSSAEGTSPYQFLIASSDVTPQENRVVLSFWDGPDRLTDAQSVGVKVFGLNEQLQPTEEVWAGDAQMYRASEVQYWVIYPTFPTAGTYGVVANVTNPEGVTYENLASVQVNADAAAPARGEPAVPSETLTLADVGTIEEITSGPPYVEDFYSLSVAEAVQSGNISVIAFATPGNCTSKLCTPVVTSLEQVRNELGPQAINYVHVEVWRDFARDVQDPAITDWNLPSEPWVFIVDGDGNVAARLDGPVSPEELKAAIAEVQNG